MTGFATASFPCANFTIGTTGPCPNNAANTVPALWVPITPRKMAAASAPTLAGLSTINTSCSVCTVLEAAEWGGTAPHSLLILPFMPTELPTRLRITRGWPRSSGTVRSWTSILYTGAEYASRTDDYDANTKAYVGYGSPHFNNTGCYTETAPSIAVSNGFNPGSLSKCTADTRAAIEGTAGFWYRFYNGPRGRFQFGTQYSYVTRQTWSGVGPAGNGNPGVTPEGLDGMVFTSFRYYLP